MNISMEELFMFFFIWIVLLAIIWIFVAVVIKKQDAENKAQPVKSEKAKVIDMQRINTNEIAIGELWVMFETESGQRVRLYVKPQNTLIVGDAGLLTWQGRKIIRFERNKTQE